MRFFVVIAADDPGTRTRADARGGSASPPRTAPLARVRSSAAVALSAILAVALFLRAWRLDWGLERGMFFPDEKDVWGTYFFAFLSPGLGSLLGHTLNYPPLYGYLVGIGTALGYATGALGPGRDVLGAIVVARLIVLVASVATVVIVWRLGRRWYGERAGLLAAALLAVVPVEAIQMHYASVDPLLGTLCALTLLAACRLAGEGSPRWAFVAGGAAGLATATKYPGVAFVAAPAWAIAEQAWRRRSPRAALVLGAAALAGLVVAGVLGCPPCVLELPRFRKELAWLGYLATSGWAPANGHIAPSLGWYAKPYLYHLVAALPFALGWPLYASALAGIAVALRERTVADRVVLVALAAYFLTMGRTSLVYPRYLVPLFAPLALLAGRALAVWWQRRRAWSVCFAAVFAYSLVLTASHVARFSYRQQEQVAAVVQQLAAGAGRRLTVGIPASYSRYFALDRPLAEVGVAPVLLRDGAWFGERPDVFVLPEWLRISIERDRNVPLLERDLALLDGGAAGYVEVARMSSTYLDRDLYVRLDPAFAGDLNVGEIGFRVYARKGLATGRRA